MNPVKFWQKSTPKEPSLDDRIKQDYDAQEPARPTSLQAKKGYFSSFSFSHKKSERQPSTVVALKESGKTEVYKLSTVDDTGSYMPPSPTLDGKRDHWVEVKEDDMMDFHLPGSECLTSYIGDQHHFYTPSSFVQSQPYIPTHSSLSIVPSLDTDNQSDLASCRSSASVS
ncbi:MAG: hypothetical protein EXX96DRAFT_537920 [Benjaminiella poitrasii]|nr:MAG: hypothetical protein EXX96DRAFT_537920 [Benjaminiella poitrasii]